MHLLFGRPSARLSVRFDKELAINLTLPMSLILYFMIFPFFLLFSWHWKGLCISLFSQIFEFPFKLFHQLFDFKMVIIVWFIMKDHRNFLWCLILNCRWCVQPPCICLYNGSNHRLLHIFDDIMQSRTVELQIIIIKR